MTTPSIAHAPRAFAELGVPAVLCTELERSGITVAFPIQAAILPDCLAGLDVCGKAPTGSGKTLAFGLAVLARFARRPRRDLGGRRKDGGRPTALILVPTRELAAQVETVLTALAATVGARVASVYGGVGYGKQLSALRRGVDVIIACPGRLEDLLGRGALDLGFVDTVVIDEADRMADMGFLPAVRRLLAQTSEDRQTLLFSATLDGAVNTLVRDHQRSPVRHEVGPTEADRGEIHHRFWEVDDRDRVAVVAETVAARGPAVVFCRTKHGADRLSQRLARSGLETAAIHGGRSQSQRDRALAAFRAGTLDALVATDVAARGLHIDGVPLVVHYDPPADVTDYVHRSGRTGRAGADGIVVSLLGAGHVASAQRMQRKLGLPSGVSAADVLTLPTVGPQRMNRSSARHPHDPPRPAGPARPSRRRKAHR